MRIKDYPDDTAKTKALGIPNLRVKMYPNAANDLYAVYTPSRTPLCPYCDLAGESKGAATVRVVWDGQEDDAGHLSVIKIHLEQDRYMCPSCKREIQYDNGFVRKGSKTSDRLNSIIGKRCLDSSPGLIAEEMNGSISKSTILNIYRQWSQEQLDEYYKHRIAPTTMGAHRIKSGKHSYYVITDINNQFLVDIVDGNTYYNYIDCLEALVKDARTSAVVSAMEPDCLLPVRNTFAKNDACIRVSNSSLYRVFCDHVRKAIPAFKKSKHLLSWIETPVYRDNKMSDLCRAARQILANEYPRHNQWISLMESLRYRVIPRWNSDTYREWKTKIVNEPHFSVFCDLLDMADPEIQESFSRVDLQGRYDDIECVIQDILLRCQHCSFDVLRSRVLLSILPVQRTITERGLLVIRYAGIDLQTLSLVLPYYRK